MQIAQVNIENLNFYNGAPETVASLSNIFQRVQNHPQIDSVEIRDKKKKSLFKADKEDMRKLAAPPTEVIDEAPKTNTKIIKYAHLNTFKIVLAENYKWECIFKGNRINVKIIDEEFYKKLKKREILFYHGDVLKGNLHIFQVMNEVANVYENREYELHDVEVIHQPRQQKMDFDEDGDAYKGK